MFVSYGDRHEVFLFTFIFNIYIQKMVSHISLLEFWVFEK